MYDEFPSHHDPYSGRRPDPFQARYPHGHYTGFSADSDPDTWVFDADLTRLLKESAGETSRRTPREPVARPTAARHSRRGGERLPLLSPWPRLLSLTFAALAAVIVAMVSVLGGLVAYNPLRIVAAPGPSSDFAAWWPILVYGPWLVASLSILRAALYRRRAVHAWVVVVLFSAIAVLLCAIVAPRTATGLAVAGLPPITALVCFHQLVRHITLTNLPRHALPQQRHGPHRSMRATPPRHGKGPGMR